MISLTQKLIIIYLFFVILRKNLFIILENQIQQLYIKYFIIIQI